MRNHKKEVLEIKELLQKQNTLSEGIITDLTRKVANVRPANQINTTQKLQDSITYLNHKEKLEQYKPVEIVFRLSWLISLLRLCIM